MGLEPTFLSLAAVSTTEHMPILLELLKLGDINTKKQVIINLKILKSFVIILKKYFQKKYHFPHYQIL